MPPPATANEFLDLVRKSGVLDEARFAELFPDDSDLPSGPRECANVLVKAELLTSYQATQLLAGKFRGFVLGPYRLLKPLGQGGMGVVYLAEHAELRRKVALKILQGDKAMDKLALERFLREARAAAALDHPNIVRIHDVGQQGQVRYLVMEYVEGETLEGLLQKGGAMGLSRAVDYISQAAAGLQHAHEKGFVHRDIKPANLMLAKDGTVKILDMGLARSVVNPRDKLTEVLDEGAAMGTVDYISPEQAVNSAFVDIRSDIYSLGIAFYALVTGKPPFSGGAAQKIAQHQMRVPTSLAALDKTVPEGLSAVVDRMLAKKPEERFQTPGDLIAALAEWLPQTGTARVVAGLSGTDMAHTDKMQAALTGLVGSGRRPVAKAVVADQKKLYWLIGGVAASVIILAVVVIAILASGGGRDDRGGVVRAAPPGDQQPAPQQPGPQRPIVTPYDRSKDRPDGLIGHWKFDAPTTHEVKDESGLGGAAVIEGAVDWSKEDGRGALRFSGEGMVRIADHPRLRFKKSESFTLATWLKPPPTLVNGAWQGVVTKPRGRGDGWYGIWLGNINNERYWVYGSTFRGDNMANLIGCRVTDDWQHVCLVQNAAEGTRRVFVNGEDVTLDGKPGPAKDSNGLGDLLIGGATIAEPSGNEILEPFRGAIAEVQLYSRALTADELAKLAAPGVRPEDGVQPVGPDGKPLNLDFETGTLKDWAAEGDAFQEMPVQGDTVAKTRPWMKMRSRHQGKFWIGGFEKRGDTPTGTLTSLPFKVTHGWASFLMGGGPSPDLAVELVVMETGDVFHRSVNTAEVEDMSRVWVDLKDVQGKEIYIRLVDKATGPWGHLNFDDFRFHEDKPK
jgi:tRNA A-37 threonylcarbamoyl transferase component Bud32